MPKHEVNFEQSEQENEIDVEQWEREDEEFMHQLEKDSQELDEMYKKFDEMCLNLDLLEELHDLITQINHKLRLLLKLHHKTIRDQYLVDLFLSQLISIYEGFVNNFLNIIKKNSTVVDKLVDIESIYENKILYNKSKKDKANDIDEVIEVLLTKTLNRPLFIKDIFETIFEFKNLESLDLFHSDSLFVAEMERALEIRNAHIHRNGSHSLENFSFEDTHKLLGDLIKFMDTLVSEFITKQNNRFEITN